MSLKTAAVRFTCGLSLMFAKSLVNFNHFFLGLFVALVVTKEIQRNAANAAASRYAYGKYIQYSIHNVLKSDGPQPRDTKWNPKWLHLEIPFMHRGHTLNICPKVSTITTHLFSLLLKECFWAHAAPIRIGILIVNTSQVHMFTHTHTRHRFTQRPPISGQICIPFIRKLCEEIHERESDRDGESEKSHQSQ